MTDNDDGRVALELERFYFENEMSSSGGSFITSMHYHGSGSGNAIFTFYYPSKDVALLKELMTPYKDKLFSAISYYDICPNQGVMTFKSLPIGIPQKEAKKVINEILKQDTGALLNSQHPDDLIKELASFKIKVCRKEKFGIEDIFGPLDDYS